MVVLSVSAALVLTGLKLWALTWLSTRMASPLEIDEFGTLARAGALLTLVTGPALRVVAVGADRLREGDRWRGRR
jgi:hypothetical protein